MKHTKHTEIFGIGNPIYDICVNIHEGYLPKLRTLLPTAEWEQSYHVGDTLFDQILASLPAAPQEVVPGGGAFNTVRVLSQLGHSTAFIGGLGVTARRWPVQPSPLQSRGSATDVRSLIDEGFSREMQRHDIRDCTVSFTERPSGMSVCLTDGTREIHIFNPAAATLLQKGEQLTFPDEHGAPQIIYIEGFILPREDLVRAVISYCNTHTAHLAVDLGAAPIAAAKKEFLLKEVLPYTTYLFGTEEECAATGLGPAELLSCLKAESDEAGVGQAACLIVKRGAAGSRLLYGTQTFDISAEPAHAVNSFGTGDAYAAFFLSELLRGATPESAARIASYGSSFFLSRFGGFLDSLTVASVQKKYHTPDEEEKNNYE